MESNPLKIKIDSSEAVKASDNLNKLNNASKSAEKGIDTLSAKTSILSAKNAILGVATSATVMQLVKMSDTWTSITSRLNLATKSTEEYTKAQEELFKISQKTRTGLESTVDLYARIARSTENLNLSQKTLFDLTETINKTGIISGATTEQMESGLMQLGQAFSAGALRGEELNSILEQMPRLAKAIAQGMGIQVGALKDVASQGKITSEVLINAITSQSSIIDNEFNQMTATIAQSSVQVGNSILALVGNLNDATSASTNTANALSNFAKFLDDNANSIIEWGVVAYASTSQLVDGVNLLYETLENTAQMILAGINTTVYGALSSLSSAILSVVEGLDSIGVGSSGSVDKMKAINNSLNESYNESKQLAVDSIQLNKINLCVLPMLI
jgi:tape measure domain-containing protein